ncbi:MAG: hypothetical protein WC350_04260 [Candidatus Micrarchaeia archaeon]|jgi:hypothetical protein
MKLPELDLYQLFLCAVTLFLLASHTFYPSFIYVDIYSIMLVVILLAIPLLPQITKLKIWNLEFERKLEMIERSVQTAKPFLHHKQKFTKQNLESLSLDLQSLLEEDHTLALAKLRIELEKIIRVAYSNYASMKGISIDRHISINRMVRELELGVPKLDKKLLAGVKDVSAVCSRAIHGEHVSPEQARRIVRLGLTVIALFGGLNEGLDDARGI